MKLLINGHEAMLPDNISFEYIRENRLFSDADDYTLAITLPLAGCAENRKIFGFIADFRVPIENLYFQAVIQSARFYRQGIVVITEITDETVKIQFLNNRSAHNWQRRTLADIYIDEMEIPELTSRHYSDPRWTPQQARMSYDQQIEAANTPVERPDINHPHNWQWPMVAFRWVNDSDGEAHNVTEGSYVGKVNSDIYWMPYLITLTELILLHAGYAADLSEWKASQMRNLVVCNAASANSPARALPHWTIKEYLENIEDVLHGTFNIDFAADRVSFTFADAVNVTEPVEVRDILDSYSASVSVDEAETAGYVKSKNLKYADRGDDDWKFESCQWFVEKAEVKPEDRFATYADFAANFSTMTADELYKEAVKNRVYYIEDEDIHIIFENHPEEITEGDESYYAARFTPRRINAMGELRHIDSDDAAAKEMKALPVRHSNFEVHLSPGEVDGVGEQFWPEEGGTYDPYPFLQIEAGEQSESNAYYDKLFVGYWPGYDAVLGMGISAPFTDSHLLIGWDEKVCPDGFSMRLNRKGAETFRALPDIDPKKKYEFSFLSKILPDVNAVFLIRGQRYLCSRLTASFDADGMSPLLKGEFYRIVS